MASSTRRLDYTASDWLTLGSKVYFAPDVSQSDTSSVYAEGNTTITLPWNFSISGAVGYQEFDSSFGASYLTWNAGLSWVWKDTVTFDVRYWDTDLSGARMRQSRHAGQFLRRARRRLDLGRHFLVGA